MSANQDKVSKLQIYNTMTRKKEEFVPLHPGEVKMYVCGPTVYDFLHVGNFFGAIFFNLVRNWLVKSGYKVTFVYNYTDVDDKIINRAQSEGVESSQVAEKYIEEFKKDFKALGLGAHTHNPRVTEFIPQIIKFIEELVENKKAYVVNGDVYFNVLSFPEYGKLSNKNIDELMTGTRADVSEREKTCGGLCAVEKSEDQESHFGNRHGAMAVRVGILSALVWRTRCSVTLLTSMAEVLI